MSTVTQPLTVKNTDVTVRIRRDVWREARRLAYREEASITQILDDVICGRRDQFKLARQERNGQ